MAFQAWWAIFFLLLVIMATILGRVILRSSTGILIDTRGRYSLNHFQLALWTVLILSTLSATVAARWQAGEKDVLGFDIENPLLALMGISAGSAALSGAIKSTKDAPGSGAQVASSGANIQMRSGGTLTISPHFSQIFEVEEGAMADQVIDITKFQNFAFTLLAAGGFILAVWNHDPHITLPKLSQGFISLIGISHTGYLGGKLPTKA